MLCATALATLSLFRHTMMAYPGGVPRSIELCCRIPAKRHAEASRVGNVKTRCQLVTICSPAIRASAQAHIRWKGRMSGDQRLAKRLRDRAYPESCSRSSCLSSMNLGCPFRSIPIFSEAPRGLVLTGFGFARINLLEETPYTALSTRSQMYLNACELSSCQCSYAATSQRKAAM